VKNILLTGGTGFIGKNFTNILKNKYKIFLLVNKTKKNLSFKNEKNINYLFFDDVDEIKDILKKKRITYFVNLATHYTLEDKDKDIIKIINANILLPSIVISSLNKKYLKKMITIGTMMEHYNNSKYYPSSFYAASKRSFEALIKYYKLKHPLLKVFNLKFYETFSDKDERNKIIPTIKKNYTNNKITKISSTKLSLNFLHVEDIINAIEIILTKKIIPGNYQIKAKKFTKIKDLIEKFNKKNFKKINCKFGNEKLFQINYNLKKLPYWRQKTLIEIKFNSIINGKN